MQTLHPAALLALLPFFHPYWGSGSSVRPPIGSLSVSCSGARWLQICTVYTVYNFPSWASLFQGARQIDGFRLDHGNRRALSGRSPCLQESAPELRNRQGMWLSVSKARAMPPHPLPRAVLGRLCVGRGTGRCLHRGWPGPGIDIETE